MISKRIKLNFKDFTFFSDRNYIILKYNGMCDRKISSIGLILEFDYYKLEKYWNKTNVQWEILIFSKFTIKNQTLSIKIRLNKIKNWRIEKESNQNNNSLKNLYPNN